MLCDEFIRKNTFKIFILVFFFVLFLSYDDPYENLFLVIFVISFLSIIRWLNKHKSVRNISCLVVLCIIFYIISTAYLYTKSYDMEMYINKPSDIKENKAVLVIYDGEGERYSLYKGLTNISMERDWIGKLKTPFLLYERKNNYKKIGKSDYISNTIEVKKRLEQVLNDQYQIYLGYLTDYKYVEEVIFNIVNDGYNKIIIVPIFLSNNDKIENLKTRVESLKLFNLNIQIRYVESLWNSEAIVNSYVGLIEKHIRTENYADVGIILIGRCPKGYEIGKYIDGVKQNLMFMKKLQSSLIADGVVDESKIRITWFDHIKPNYLSEVRSLFEYGVGEILCIYIKPSATNIENNVIARSISRKVEIPEGVNIKIIDGFLMDSNFIEELKKRVQFVNLQKWD